MEKIPEAPDPQKTPGARGVRTDNSFARETLLQPRLVQPLDAETYNEVFYGKGGFVQNSTEYWDDQENREGPMPAMTREILQQIGPRRVLSVGAGDGKFDGDVLGKTPLDAFVAVEPNIHHAAKLYENTLAHPWQNRHIVEGFFHKRLTKEDLHGGEFDAALFTHCMYFFPDPGATLAEAQKLMHPKSAMIVLHQTEEKGVCPFYRHFAKRLGLTFNPHVPRQDHAMSTETISRELQELGVRHAVGQGECGVWVDHLLSKDAQDVHWKIPSFFMNTDLREFPEGVLREMRDYIGDHSRPVGNKRMFDHPQGFIVIPGPQSDWSHPDMEMRVTQA